MSLSRDALPGGPSLAGRIRKMQRQLDRAARRMPATANSANPGPLAGNGYDAPSGVITGTLTALNRATRTVSILIGSTTFTGIATSLAIDMRVLEAGANAGSVAGMIGFNPYDTTDAVVVYVIGGGVLAPDTDNASTGHRHVGTEDDGPLLTGPFPTAHIGGAIDYVEFAADGQVTLHGTARVTKEFNLSLSALNTGSTKPTETVYGVTSGWAFSLNDFGYMAAFEVPLDWDSTTNIDISVHWYDSEAYATNSGEVNWRLRYQIVGEDMSDTIGGTIGSLPFLDSGDVNLPTTAYRLTETMFSIPAADLTAHHVVLGRLTRIALVGGNNPTAGEPVVLGMEVEYVANTLGEAL